MYLIVGIDPKIILHKLYALQNLFMNKISLDHDQNELVVIKIGKYAKINYCIQYVVLKILNWALFNLLASQPPNHASSQPVSLSCCYLYMVMHADYLSNNYCVIKCTRIQQLLVQQLSAQ